MVALAKRIVVRPKIDEVCPAWARSLIPCTKQEHGLGIPNDKIPQATLEELKYFFPLPEPPKRLRRIGGKQEGKYARTCGLVVFLSCLPFALAKQLDLFADVPAERTGEVAVLSIRGLSDLAKKVGISYDRVQRWMTILVALGFIWRFRDGRRTIYIIPLTAYVPRPSAEVVRARLSALIHSQFVEIEQDGQVRRADRDPELTDLLLEIRAKFEARYQLAPSLDLDLVEDRAWENTLSDIQQALPGLTHADLYTIVPIVTRHLLAERGTGKGRRFVLKRTDIESTFSREEIDREVVVSARSTKPRQGRVQEQISKSVKRGTIESWCDSQDDREEDLLAHTQQQDAERLGGKSRFDQEDIHSTPGQNGPSQTVSDLPGSSAAHKQNLPLSSGGSLTLGAPELQDSENHEENAPTQASFEQEQRRGKELWCQEQGQEIARIFDDQKSLDFYVGVHRTTDPMLVRALFIKALYQADHGGFKDSIGAYFNFMWEKIWGPFRTYDAACAKWKKWGKKGAPQGIPPNIQEKVALHKQDSYTQIAKDMGYQWSQAACSAWLPESLSAEESRPSMTRAQAVDLVGALQNKASWYLTDPQLHQEDVSDTESFWVDALWPDGQVAVFATFDEWQEVHQQMLLLPEEINAWFEAERAQHLQEEIIDGVRAEEREECVHAALAMYAYRGWNATAFPWEQLVTLGRPLIKRVERADEETIKVTREDIVLQEGQLCVRVNEELLPVDEYQCLEAAGSKQEYLEDQAYTVEGQLAMLQAQCLLGLHIWVLRTFGLSIYQKLGASGPGQDERGEGSDAQEAPEETTRAEESRAGLPGSGMPLAMAWQYLELLTAAVDPRFYQVRCRLRGPGTGFVVVESQLSGKVYVYDSATEVEQALADLSAQRAEEAQVG